MDWHLELAQLGHHLVDGDMHVRNRACTGADYLPAAEDEHRRLGLFKLVNQPRKPVLIIFGTFELEGDVLQHQFLTNRGAGHDVDYCYFCHGKPLRGAYISLLYKA